MKLLYAGLSNIGMGDHVCWAYHFGILTSHSGQFSPVSSEGQEMSTDMS